MINDKGIEYVKKIYTKGTRVKLINMPDFQVPPKGTEGIVLGGDDLGNIMVAWDTGSSLNVILDVDEIITI